MLVSRLAIFLHVFYVTTPAFSLNGNLNRRTFGQQAAWNVAATVAAPAVLSLPAGQAAHAAGTMSYAKLSERLEQTALKQPPVSMGSEMNGLSNTYFPEFMKGTWDTTQTLTNVQTPLGKVYLGGPNGDERIAEQSLQESAKQLDKPVKLQLRFLPTKWGVAEDRLFNTANRLNAFAGRNVVYTVEYANVGGSNRPSVLAMGGTEDDPLQTTLVRFKGPAAQKTFVTSSSSAFATTTTTTPSEDDSSSSLEEWMGSEGTRQIFALTNANTAPPITTDSELVWKLTQVDSRHVVGRLRIIGYLNAQSDKLYFEARNRAVSIQDYTMDMKRMD